MPVLQHHMEARAGFFWGLVAGFVELEEVDVFLWLNLVGLQALKVCAENSKVDLVLSRSPLPVAGWGQMLLNVINCQQKHNK